MKALPIYWAFSDQLKLDENLVRNKTVCGLRFAL